MCPNKTNDFTVSPPILFEDACFLEAPRSSVLLDVESAPSWSSWTLTENDGFSLNISTGTHCISSNKFLEIWRMVIHQYLGLEWGMPGWPLSPHLDTAKRDSCCKSRAAAKAESLRCWLLMASGGSVLRLYKRLYQWSFLVPLIGAKGYIITQLAI